MLNLGVKEIKKGFVVIVFLMLLPLSVVSSPDSYSTLSSFLPMEDALAPARAVPGFANENIKPYRQSFNLANGSSERGYINFTSTDLLAFIFLAGVYLMFVRRNSESRNTTF